MDRERFFSMMALFRALWRRWPDICWCDVHVKPYDPEQRDWFDVVYAEEVIDKPESGRLWDDERRLVRVKERVAMERFEGPDGQRVRAGYGKASGVLVVEFGPEAPAAFGAKTGETGPEADHGG